MPRASNRRSFFKVRAKLFRFSKELNEWKERGTGEVRILQHKQSDKFRVLMRRDKTLKICMNHYVNKKTILHENMGSDRAWNWTAVDYADGDRDECVLAIRFANSENAQKFKKAYDTARQYIDEKSKGKNPKRPESQLPKEGEEEKGEDGKEKAPKSSMAAALQDAEEFQKQQNSKLNSTQNSADGTKTEAKKDATNSTDAKEDKKGDEKKAAETVDGGKKDTEGAKA